MQPHRILPLGIVVLALSGCEDELYDTVPVTYASSEGYAPEQQQQQEAARTVNTELHADFQIPKENPHGDLRVTSYGLVDVGAKNKPDQRIAAVHVRMALTNNSDQSWTIDTREQRLSVEGYGSSVVAFATADPGTPPPTVTAPAKGRRSVDLYFPLPDALQKQETLPKYEALWRVHVGDLIVEGSAPFESPVVTSPPPVATDDYNDVPDYAGGGTAYWYNPYYASYGFYAAPFYAGFPFYVYPHPYYGYYRGYPGYYH
ncbi:MAG TPA: hypothetical protein VH142_28345, partial [Polyangiaceae bacterium]|nr:hypothetical protein [Polyangiaceae bacterium]